MRALIIFLICFIRNRFRSAAEIEAENIVLRHQLNVVPRKAPKGRLTGVDRALFVSLWSTETEGTRLRETATRHF